MKKTKVYCSDCKYLKTKIQKVHSRSHKSYECQNKEFIIYNDTWLGKEWHIPHPSNLNIGNNCKGFEKK